MATITNNSSGNFTTTATWSLIDPTSFNNTKASTNTTTTSFVSSAAFTPGAITIDGIGIQISTRNTGGGTVSTRLALAGVGVAGTTVTININDINAQPNGWVFFKFAAPVLLLAATAYTVQMQSSVNGTVSIFRSTGVAGDWSRYLRTTTNQAPAAGDLILVNGEFISAGVNNVLTVTCDNTAATVFGQLVVSSDGVFQAATGASTAYQFITNGDLLINADAVVQLGTLATPVPSTSSFTLQLNQGGVNVNKGIILTVNGKLASYGNAITTRAFLAADASAAATTLTSNVSTGWKSGDQIAIASTTRTNTETELKTMSANATGTSIPIAAISFAHSGSNPTRAELGNITRNVRIKSDSTSFGTYIATAGAVVVDLNYTQLSDMGSGTANKRGIDVTITTGSFTLKGCSMHDFQSNSFGVLANQTTNANITVDDLVLYNMRGTGFSLNSTLMTASTISVNNVLALSASLTFNAQAASVTNITCASSTISFSQVEVLSGFLVDNLVSHSANGTGISITSSTLNKLPMSNLTVWRNSVRGIAFATSANVEINTATVFGNGTFGLDCNSSSLIYLNNITFNAGTTLTQPTGLALTSSTSQIFLDTCTFGTTTTHSTADILVSTNRTFHEVFLTNCTLASTTEVGTQTNLITNAIIGSVKHDQTAAVHKNWKRTGTTTTDTAIVSTPLLSQRLTPNNAGVKLYTNDRTFSIPSGKTAKITVAVRRSVAGDGTAYNGALPRLWMRSNNSAGVTTATLLATATGASLGAFETLSGTTPAINDDTVNSLYLDLDGTAGWVNVDNWKVQIIGGAANGTNINSEDYWQDGTAFTGINNPVFIGAGQETYWINGAPTQELYAISALETGRFFLLFEG